MVPPASKRNDHLSQYDTDYLRLYHWWEYKRAVIYVFFLFPFEVGGRILQKAWPILCVGGIYETGGGNYFTRGGTNFPSGRPVTIFPKVELSILETRSNLVWIVNFEVCDANYVSEEN